MIDKIREEELREKRDKLKAQGVKSTKMEVVEEKELNEIIKKHEKWADFFGMDCTNPQIDEDGRTTFEEGITYDTNDGLQKINEKEMNNNEIIDKNKDDDGRDM